MDTSLPTPMTARVYVNLPEGKTWKMGDHGGPKNDFAHGPTRQGSMISARAPLHRSWWPPPTPAVPCHPADPDPTQIWPILIHHLSTCATVFYSLFLCLSFKQPRSISNVSISWRNGSWIKFRRSFWKMRGNRQIPRETPKALPASSIYHPWFFHGFFPSKMTTGYHRSTSVASPKILANGRSASVPKMVKRCQKMSEIALRNLSFADLEPWRNGVGYKILIDVIYIYKVTTWHAGLSKTLKDKQFQ